MRKIINVLLAGVAFSIMAVAARAADLALEARLIWGVNDDATHATLQPVDPDLAGKLHRTFKWKNYFEITNKTARIPLNQNGDLKMSDACTIRVKNLGGSRVEVYCIGHGKEVHKGSYTLLPPQWLVLGGNSSDNTAWFIGLRSVDGKNLKTAVTKN